MEQTLLQFTQFLEQNAWVSIVILLWTLPWKGVALWKAAKIKDKWWFIILLVANTLGILEILYIFVISKKRAKKLQLQQAQM